MQDPQPDQPTNWVPNRKVVVGAATGPTIGSYIAVLTLPFVIPHYPSTVDAASLTAAYTGLCVAVVSFIASYFTPNAST